MMADSKTHYPILLSHLLDKCRAKISLYLSVKKDEVIFDIKQEAFEEAESVVPSPVYQIVDDNDAASQELQPPMKKKLKGLAMHTLSTPSEELTINEKLTREMRRYEEYHLNMSMLFCFYQKPLKFKATMVFMIYD